MSAADLRRRSTAVLTLTAAAILLLGPAAGAWFSTSTAFDYRITTGAWDDPDEDPGDGQDPGHVWICKLTGNPDAPRIKDGPNPIQVAGAATTDGRFNDRHGSPVVEDGEVDCEEVLAEPPQDPVVDEGDRSDPRSLDTPADDVETEAPDDGEATDAPEVVPDGSETEAPTADIEQLPAPEDEPRSEDTPMQAG